MENNMPIINDQKRLYLLNKFLKDKLLFFFIDNSELFDHKIDLFDFYFTYEDMEDNRVLKLNIPTRIKKIIKDNIRLDCLIIKIDL